jgi:cell division transport system permease protein
MTSFRYALRDTFRLLFRHWGLSLLTLVTAASVLYILGFTGLFSLNLRQMISRVEGGLVVQVFMKKGQNADPVVALVKTMPTVTSAAAVSPEQALEKLRAKLGNQARAVTLLGENPLPWSVEVQVGRAEQIAPLVRDLIAVPEVEEVLYSGKLVERLTTISRAATTASGTILVLAAIISTLVIFNTIRIAIYSRREEIEVMLLVGATRTYISLPFVIQGTLLGAGGALLAIAGIWGTYASIMNAVRTSLPFLDIIVDRRTLLQFFLLLFATGATLGWVCSWLAVSRFISRASRAK